LCSFVGCRAGLRGFAFFVASASYFGYESLRFKNCSGKLVHSKVSSFDFSVPLVSGMLVDDFCDHESEEHSLLERENENEIFSLNKVRL